MQKFWGKLDLLVSFASGAVELDKMSDGLRIASSEYFICGIYKYVSNTYLQPYPFDGFLKGR